MMKRHKVSPKSRLLLKGVVVLLCILSGGCRLTLDRGVLEKNISLIDELGYGDGQPASRYWSEVLCGSRYHAAWRSQDAIIRDIVEQDQSIIPVLRDAAYRYRTYRFAGAAVDAMYQIKGSEVLSLFKDIIWSTNAQGRVESLSLAALDGCVRIDSSDAWCVVAATATNHPDSAVRMQAVVLLGKRESKSSIPPLVCAIADRDAEVASMAAHYLGCSSYTQEVLSAVMPYTTAKEVKLRLMSSDVALYLGNTNVLTIFRSGLVDDDPSVRSISLDAVGRCAFREDVDAIGMLLSDPIWSIRRDAASHLGQIDDSRAMPYLKQAVHDVHPDVRSLAVMGICSKPGWQKQIHLVDLLKRETDEGVSLRIAREIIRTQEHDVDAYSVWIAATASTNREVQRLAIRGLGEMKTPFGKELLMVLWQSTNVIIRTDARKVLDLYYQEGPMSDQGVSPKAPIKIGRE